MSFILFLTPNSERALYHQVKARWTIYLVVEHLQNFRYFNPNDLIWHEKEDLFTSREYEGGTAFDLHDFPNWRLKYWRLGDLCCGN